MLSLLKLAKTSDAHHAIVTRPICILKLSKATDLHMGIISGEVLMTRAMDDTGINVTRRPGDKEFYGYYSFKGKLLTDTEMWHIMESYKGWRMIDTSTDNDGQENDPVTEGMLDDSNYSPMEDDLNDGTDYSRGDWEY